MSVAWRRKSATASTACTSASATPGAWRGRSNAARPTRGCGRKCETGYATRTRWTHTSSACSTSMRRRSTGERRWRSMSEEALYRVRLAPNAELAVGADGGVDLLWGENEDGAEPFGWDGGDGELKALLRDRFAGLGAEERAQLLDRLAGSDAHREGGSPSLSTSLFGIREVLRERLPVWVVDERQPIGLS